MIFIVSHLNLVAFIFLSNRRSYCFGNFIFGLLNPLDDCDCKARNELYNIYSAFLPVCCCILIIFAYRISDMLSFLISNKEQGSRSPIIGPVNSQKQKNQIVCKTYLWSFYTSLDFVVSCVVFCFRIKH